MNVNHALACLSACTRSDRIRDGLKGRHSWPRHLLRYIESLKSSLPTFTDTQIIMHRVRLTKSTFKPGRNSNYSKVRVTSIRSSNCSILFTKELPSSLCHFCFFTLNVPVGTPQLSIDVIVEHNRDIKVTVFFFISIPCAS